ncbi:MAG: YIP1 family protein [Bacillota bacterium]
MNSMIPGAPAPAPLSPWRALWSVVTDPIATFGRLGPRPAIFPAYLLQMVAGLAGFVLSYPYLMQLIEQGAAAAPGTSPEQVAFTKMTALTGGLVSAVAAPWVAGLLVSLVALFMAQFQGGSLPFSAFFGMVGYARLPLVIATLLGGLWVRLLGQPLDISPGALLSAEASPVLKAALGTLNPFGLWYYALLAIGFAALHQKPPAKGAAFALLLFLLYLFFAMAGGGLSAVFTPQP